MKNKLQKQIVEFAQASLKGNTELFDFAKDYFNHWKALNVAGCEKVEFAKTDKDGNVLTFVEKEARMNKKLKEAICQMANVSNEELLSSPELFANHPTVNWATFAIISYITDMIIPETIIDSTGLYTDIRTIGYGDSAVFDFKPRDLFLVSKAGRKKAQAELQKQYNGQVVVNPIQHMISTSVDMYRVLANLESLAEFMMKVARSIETAIATETYIAMDTAMQNLPTDATTGLQVTGWDAPSVVSLGQKVSAWNQGRKAILVGTQVALSKVLPQDANYRYTLDSDYVKIGYVREFNGFATLVLPQVADWTTPFKLLLDDNHIYVISPSSDKLVKLVFGGSTLTNISTVFANANLMQTGTMYKQWGLAVATNSIAGLVTLA